jgi:hypothetical protein
MNDRMLSDCTGSALSAAAGGGGVPAEHRGPLVNHPPDDRSAQRGIRDRPVVPGSNHAWNHVAMIVDQQQERPVGWNPVQGHGYDPFEKLGDRTVLRELPREVVDELQQPFRRHRERMAGVQLMALEQRSHDRQAGLEDRVRVAEHDRLSCRLINPQRKPAEDDRIPGFDAGLGDRLAVEERAVAAAKIRKYTVIPVNPEPDVSARNAGIVDRQVADWGTAHHRIARPQGMAVSSAISRIEKDEHLRDAFSIVLSESYGPRMVLR